MPFPLFVLALLALCLMSSTKEGRAESAIKFKPYVKYIWGFNIAVACLFLFV
jgi:hypothetical protein